jgi:branched-chain amino acid transport system substrate-binding protein
LTGRACSPFGSSWNLDSVSVASGLARAAAQAGAKTWFLVVPDTALGLAVLADASRTIEAGGGRVLGQSRHPAGMTDYTSVTAQAIGSGAKAIGLLDIGDDLSLQLARFQDAGVFGDNRFVCAFLPSIEAIHAAGAKAARGLTIALPFYWDQNDQSRLFARRFQAVAGQMPNSAHAGAYAATRHFLRAVVATEGLEAGPIADEMRRTPVYFFGRTGKLRLDGRLSIDLSLLRAKAPEAMKGDWDHFDQIGAVPAADVFRPLNQSGCPLTI